MAVQKLARCAELLRRKVTNEIEITSASSILDTICETLAVHCPLDIEGLISTAHTLLACNATESVQTLLNRLTQHASGQKESENLVLDCLLPFMRSAIVSLQQLKLPWPSELQHLPSPVLWNYLDRRFYRALLPLVLNSGVIVHIARMWKLSLWTGGQSYLLQLPNSLGRMWKSSSIVRELAGDSLQLPSKDARLTPFW
jgi:hypothetical protein